MDDYTIVCYGDSLTSGYPNFTPPFLTGTKHGTGNVKSQYLYWLQKSLANAGYSIELHNRGIPGNTTIDLLDRLDRDVISLSPDIVIIIIGSNDIFNGYNHDEIITNIKHLHHKIQQKRTYTIGATIPSIRIENQEFSPISNYIEFVGKLKIMFEDQKIPYADLFHSMSDRNNLIHSSFVLSDGVHLTIDGNKKISSDLYPIVKNVVEK